MSAFNIMKSSYTYCKGYCDSVNATASQNQELLKYREPVSKSSRNGSRFWPLFIIPAKVLYLHLLTARKIVIAARSSFENTSNPVLHLVTSMASSIQPSSRSHGCQKAK
jgi:hypothetical protein